MVARRWSASLDFGAHLREQFDHLAQVSGAAPGQQALLDPLAVGEQADAIAGVERQLRQRDRCRDRRGRAWSVRAAAGGEGQSRIGSGAPRPRGTHQAAAVEHDPHRLAALGLVLARDQAAASRGGGPADVAQVVAFAVLAQALEVAAQAALPRLAQLQVDLAAAREKDLLLFAGAQGRIDAHASARAAPSPSARRDPSGER